MERACLQGGGREKKQGDTHTAVLDGPVSERLSYSNDLPLPDIRRCEQKCKIVKDHDRRPGPNLSASLFEPDRSVRASGPETGRKRPV
eukprot:9263489-Pyramimonas_sp.AAC.1